MQCWLRETTFKGRLEAERSALAQVIERLETLQDQEQTLIAQLAASAEELQAARWVLGICCAG